MITIKIAKGNEFLHAEKIRETVFVKGQQIPKHMDFDGKDAESKHFLLFAGEKPVGCARLRLVKGKAKIERMAILESHRGKGHGSSLVKHILKYCKRMKIKTAYLHSQIKVKDFYKKHGFIQKGSKFKETGIDHVLMQTKI